MPSRVPYEDQLKPLSLRVTPASWGWIESKCRALRVSRTILVRAMLTVAAGHWPEVAAKVQQLQQAESASREVSKRS